MKTWFNRFGVVKDEYEAEFQKISKKFSKILKAYEGKVSYRDLYDIGMQAGADAAGKLVRDHVNRRESRPGRQKH